jgi:hypothetical protein
MIVFEDNGITQTTKLIDPKRDLLGHGWCAYHASIQDCMNDCPEQIEEELGTGYTREQFIKYYCIPDELCNGEDMTCAAYTPYQSDLNTLDWLRHHDYD